jgi:GNAT superfamily N-acetyltransferase
MYLGFLLSNIAAIRARALICKSEQLRQVLWLCRQRAVVMPSGVDLELFCPGPQEIARKQLGWGLDHPVVIFNARNDPSNKELDLANMAMQMVGSRIPQAELHLIENVEHSRMPLYYRAADALLCVSRSEGSPNDVKEALACNLPVVSIAVGDVRDRLKGVRPSAVVASDAKALGEALVQILLERKRSNGREHVAHLGLDHIAKRVLQVYQSALKSTADETLDVSDVKIISLKDEEMVCKVARLHLNAFAGYLNCSLGRNYIRAFIRWFIVRKDAIVIAAVDHDQEVVGYAIGAPLGYDRILNRELFWVVVAAAVLRPWLFLRPSFCQALRGRLLTLLRRQDASIPNCELPEPRMSLVAIGVGRSWRRRGIGLLLMQAFTAKARELKMRSLALSVLKEQRFARQFYEKLGWQPCACATEIGVAMIYCLTLDEDRKCQ